MQRKGEVRKHDRELRGGRGAIYKGEGGLSVCTFHNNTGHRDNIFFANPAAPKIKCSLNETSARLLGHNGT